MSLIGKFYQSWVGWAAHLTLLTISLRLDDSSIRYPKEIVGNLLVQVKRIIMLMNLVVMKMEDILSKAKKHTIILGIPFMHGHNQDNHWCPKREVDHDNLKKDCKF